MATLVKRLARVGTVGFAIAWVVATLVMTAPMLGSGTRPTLETPASSAEEPEARPDAADEPSITESAGTDASAAATTEPSAPTSSLAVPTAGSIPGYLTTPDTGGSARTEVLPSVAIAPDPIQSQPDYTG